MKLGIPSIGMQSLDWWIFESMMIICGTFGVLAQSSQIILMNIAGGLVRVGNGLDQAACLIIGNIIGGDNHVEAKHYYKVFMFYSIFIVVVEVALLYTFRF